MYPHQRCNAKKQVSSRYLAEQMEADRSIPHTLVRLNAKRKPTGKTKQRNYVWQST